MVTINERYSNLQNKKISRFTIRKKRVKQYEYLERRNAQWNSFPDNVLIAKLIFRVIVDQRGGLVIRFRVRVIEDRRGGLVIRFRVRVDQKWKLPLRSHEQLKIRKTGCRKSGYGSSS
jgi:hypothetical protein